MDFLKDHCTFQPLNATILESSKPFDCNDSDLNDFFLNDSLDYSNQLLGKTYCFTLDRDPTNIVCAFTVANDNIKALLLPKSRKNKLTRPIPNIKRGLKTFPAVLIGRLGVNRNFQRKNIGTELMDFIKYWFLDEENKTGCRFVVVDAYTKDLATKYYRKNGFTFLFNNESEEKEYMGVTTKDPLKTRLMYFDLITLTKN